MRQSKGGGPPMFESIYVPDTREEYCNAVQALYDLILAKIDEVLNGDKKFKELQVLDFLRDIELIQDAIDQAKKDCLNATDKDDTEILPNEHYEKDDRRIVDQFKAKNVQLHRELFRYLNAYLNYEGYFMDDYIDD
jgi:hypothetical protein